MTLFQLERLFSLNCDGKHQWREDNYFEYTCRGLSQSVIPVLKTLR